MNNFTLNNNGSVWGGDGYNGGIAVSGNKISIRNYRNVYGVMVLVAQEVAEVQG
ncbi:hypothetical protein O5558_03445 [Escherichia coli]|nr:hypothetical protein [Escherichia coli]